MKNNINNKKQLGIYNKDLETFKMFYLNNFIRSYKLCETNNEKRQIKEELYKNECLTDRQKDDLWNIILKGKIEI